MNTPRTARKLVTLRALTALTQSFGVYCGNPSAANFQALQDAMLAFQAAYHA